MRFKTVITLVIYLFLVKEVRAQERKISGKVLDFRGRPVAGVNIVVKDYPSINTISGVDGQFRLTVFNFSKVLQFSYPGMKNKEVSIVGLKDILVIMDYMVGKNPHPWSFALKSQIYASDLYNKSKSSDTSWVSSGAPAIGLSFELEYFFDQRFGIITGIGINKFAAKAWLNNFSNYGVNNVPRIDKDNESYFLYTSVYSIEENSHVSAISFPLKLRYLFRSGKKWEFFIDAGIKMLITSKATVKALGQAELEGYYPSYPVVLYDVPEYGFTTYDINSEHKIQDYNKLVTAFTTSCGISRSFGKNWTFDLGLFYDNAISDLKYTKPVYEADYINTSGIVDKTYLRAFGMHMGFKYNL